MSTTSAKHFAQFKRYAKKWLKAFGLTSWSVEFNHKDLENNLRLAECGVDAIGKFAELNLNVVWEDNTPTLVNLSNTACHEVLHVLLGPMAHLSSERFVTERELEHAEHEVIRSILQFIFPRIT